LHTELVLASRIDRWNLWQS